PARPALPRAGRLHRRGERLPRRAGAPIDRGSPPDGRDGDGRPRRAERIKPARSMSSRVTVKPDPFTLIDYDVDEIASIVEDGAGAGGAGGVLAPSHAAVPCGRGRGGRLPPPPPGHMAEVVGGGAVLWISGATSEDPRRPRHFEPTQARTDLVEMLLRAKDR